MPPISANWRPWWTRFRRSEASRAGRAVVLRRCTPIGPTTPSHTAAACVAAASVPTSRSAARPMGVGWVAIVGWWSGRSRGSKGAEAPTADGLAWRHSQSTDVVVLLLDLLEYPRQSILLAFLSHNMPRANTTSNWPGRPGWSPTQAPHRSGRVKQETHLVTPPRPTFQVPIIGFSALLQLVEWYQVRLRRDQQGGSSCVDPEPPLSPPAPDQGSPSPQCAPALAQLDRRIPRANPG